MSSKKLAKNTILTLKVHDMNKENFNKSLIYIIFFSIFTLVSKGRFEAMLVENVTVNFFLISTMKRIDLEVQNIKVAEKLNYWKSLAYLLCTTQISIDFIASVYELFDKPSYIT